MASTEKLIPITFLVIKTRKLASTFTASILFVCPSVIILKFKHKKGNKMYVVIMKT